MEYENLQENKAHSLASKFERQSHHIKGRRKVTRNEYKEIRG
jgi:hypothetical protein